MQRSYNRVQVLLAIGLSLCIFFSPVYAHMNNLEEVDALSSNTIWENPDQENILASQKTPIIGESNISPMPSVPDSTFHPEFPFLFIPGSFPADKGLILRC
jgi:hypothetical protein